MPTDLSCRPCIPKRWTPKAKTRIVEGVLAGTITRAEVQQEHPDISDEELDVWVKDFEKFGRAGLTLSKGWWRIRRTADRAEV